MDRDIALRLILRLLIAILARMMYPPPEQFNVDSDKLISDVKEFMNADLPRS